MNRINQITQINPVWAANINEFLNKYPEFKQYEYLVPISPVTGPQYKNVNTLFEGLMWYICAAGVRYTYAVKQWQIIYPLIEQTLNNTWSIVYSNITTKLDIIGGIQPKKLSIYKHVMQYMRTNNITHIDITIADIYNICNTVNGVGDGCLAWCKRCFTGDDDCVEYTDIKFKKGFMKIYHVDTLALRKQKAREWANLGFGRISSMMIMLISCYA
jgi:hypothetical protein